MLVEPVTTLEGLPDVPVIFITASKQSGLREAAKQVGAAGFFEKPYDADELLKSIAQTLGSKPAQMAIALNSHADAPVLTLQTKRV